MKNILWSFIIYLLSASSLMAQHTLEDSERKKIYSLIDKYSQARENKDTVLLKKILTNEIDQLVSTGEWRDGINASVKGMLKSSASSPGTRTLAVEKIRLLAATCAIVDCKYEIQNADGTPRKMWSSFIVISDKGQWRISAIRNMLPTGQ